MKNKISLPSLITLIGLIMCYQNTFSQEDKTKRPSPPAEASGKSGATTVTIKYSQPSVKERKVWGELVPYGQVWRAGANEATTFSIDKDSKINGQALAAGTYGFFVIPAENEWTFIFNKVANQWGAFKYDEKQDALRIKVKPVKSTPFAEKLVYTIDAAGTVTLAWESIQAKFTVK